MKKKTIVGFLMAGLIIVGMMVACVWVFQQMRDAVGGNDTSTNTSSPAPTSPNSPSINESELNKSLPLGNPSNAAPNTVNANNYLIPGNYYTVSYNQDKGIPNWVSWTLTTNDIGKTSRQNDFRPNEDLPNTWKRIMPNDYSGSGYDRGHLCPSADRSNSIEANSATFLMSNMTPQTHEMNAGPWEKLETYSRSLARRNTTLYIIAGQYGENGKLKNKVTIPTNFWKIIMVIPNGTQINQNTRVIAVDMPNINGIEEKGWRDYKTTVNQIEQKTGYKFLGNLPADIQKTLKLKVDSRQ
jgi:endonuclease G, mitochondrial